MKILLFLLAFSALGAEPAKVAETLADGARSLAPEFAADGLIRIAECGKTADAKRRQALLEDAFRLAAAAQEPYRRVALSQHDSAAAFRHRAFLQGLDRLSLQSRAVKALLEINKVKARDLFTQIVPPRADRLTCGDRLVYDFSAYYEALAEVAKTAFSPKELADEENVHFLERYLGTPQSPAEVGPIAQTLATLGLTPQQLALAAATFANALKDLTADPRSFTISSARGTREPESIRELAQTCRRAGIATVSLIQAYRTYLVRNLGGPGCRDAGQGGVIAFGMSTGAAQELIMDAVTAFNTRLVAEAWPEGQVQPIGAEEARPSGYDDVPQSQPDCSGSDCRQIAEKYQALLLDARGMPMPAAQKATSEWRARLKEVLAAIGEWQPVSGEPADRQFRAKCSLFNELINLAPSGPARDDVLRADLQFLAGNPYQNEHRMEWFLGVGGLIGRAFTDRLSLSWLTEEMKASRDPVIAFYAALEEFAPQPADRWVRLM